MRAISIAGLLVALAACKSSERPRQVYASSIVVKDVAGSCWRIQPKRLIGDASYQSVRFVKVDCPR